MVTINVQALSPRDRRQAIIAAFITLALVILLLFVIGALTTQDMSARRQGIDGIDFLIDLAWNPSTFRELATSFFIGLTGSLVGLLVFFINAVLEDTASQTGYYTGGFIGILTVLLYALPVLLIRYLWLLVSFIF